MRLRYGGAFARCAKGTLARFAFVAALALVSCAVVKVPPKAAGDTTPPNLIEYGQEAEEVLALLSYYQRMLALSGDDQRKEYLLVSQAYAKDKNEKDRLRLAMLMSLPNTSLRDEPKLIALLDGTQARTTLSDSPRRNLIALLLRQAQERNRLANQIGQANQARDGARELADRAEKDKAKLEAQAQEERRRAEELQEKLDALLAIERELRSRPPGRTPR